MNGNDVVAKLKELNLPEGSYVSYGSSPMAIEGIRDVNDIDILATPKVYELLKFQGWEVAKKGLNDEPVASGDFEVHKTWSFSEYSPTLQELQSRARVVEGIPFASLIDVLKWKEASVKNGWNIEKNQKDIELIHRHLREKEPRDINFK